MKMNVMFIMNYSPPYSGNFMSSIWTLEKKIKEEKGSCIYVYPESAENLGWVNEMRNNGAIIYFKNGVFWHDIKLYEKAIKKNNIDIIYLHFWSLTDALSIRLLQKKHHNLKFGIHHHNEYVLSKSHVRERIKHWILDADFHIGCGSYVASEVKEAGYRNVHHIDNCIDFRRLDQWEEIDLSKLNILSEGGVLLLTFTSYSFSAKGIDISLAAIQKAREKGAAIELLIVIADCKDEMNKQIEDFFEDIVPGWVHIIDARSDVASLYHSADAYLNSSRTEGLCYSSIEAVYCGCQVIQSDIPQNRLDIPGTIIFEKENVEQLTEKLIEYANHREHNSEAQRKYVTEKYDLGEWALRCYSVLANV
mgnify:CR=1 FL=1